MSIFVISNVAMHKVGPCHLAFTFGSTNILRYND
jgi:hypothetical protein